MGDNDRPRGCAVTELRTLLHTHLSMLEAQEGRTAPVPSRFEGKGD